jgi:hypothetical protein
LLFDVFSELILLQGSPRKELSTGGDEGGGMGAGDLAITSDQCSEKKRCVSCVPMFFLLLMIIYVDLTHFSIAGEALRKGS